MPGRHAPPVRDARCAASDADAFRGGNEEAQKLGLLTVLDAEPPYPTPARRDFS